MRSDNRTWFLEGFTDENKRLHRIPLRSFPFRIGRGPGLSLSLSSVGVSHRHAEILLEDDQPLIRDLESTNGTYLNGVRIKEPERLTEGDVIHFATLEFRIRRLDEDESKAIFGPTRSVTSPLPRLEVERALKVGELLKLKAVSTVFQPVVDLGDSQVVGYEALGRSSLSDFDATTTELFELATLIGSERKLSRLFREACGEACVGLPGRPLIFINTHPAELGSSSLIESLSDLQSVAREARFVLEIHEGSIAAPGRMRELMQQFRDLDMRLAYDDFGAGQARLLELAEAPPDYLKFDQALVAGVEKSSSKSRLLRSLASLATELGIATVAEGIETSAAAEICRELGFNLGQGYLWGEPLSPAELRRS